MSSPGAHDASSALLFRRAIADEWQEYCLDAQPVSGMIDFMELLPLASGATALKLAERVALCAERDPVGTSRSVDALFTNEGFEPSSLSGYFNDAMELLRWELEDLGIVPEQPQIALAVVETDPPPAVRTKVDELIGVTQLDRLRWPAYAVIAGVGSLVIGWPALLIVGAALGLARMPALAALAPAGQIARRWDAVLDETCWASQLTYAELATQVGYMNGSAARRCKNWLEREKVDPLWDNYYRLLRLVQAHSEAQAGL